jgi:hypothetical protein
VLDADPPELVGELEAAWARADDDDGVVARGIRTVAHFQRIGSLSLRASPSSRRNITCG